MNKKLLRNIPLDYLYTFLQCIDLSAAVWVLYLGYRGMSLLQIGLLEGIFHTTGMILELPSGVVADLFGRKRTILAGRLLFTASCITMLLANGFWGFAAAFVLQAASYNLNSGAEEALVYDSLKECGQEDRYLHVSSRINLLIELAQALAKLLGGILAEISFMVCYLGATVLALVSAVPALFFEEPPVERPERVSVRSHAKLSANILRTTPGLGGLLGFYSLCFASFSVLFFYAQSYFFDLGLSRFEVSLVMLAAGGVNCLAALSSPWLFRRIGNWVRPLALTTLGVAYVGFGAELLWLAIPLLLLTSFTNALLYPIQINALNTMIPSQQRATLVSVSSMLYSVFMVALFPLAGAAGDSWGLASVFPVLGFAILIWAIGAFIIQMRQKRKVS